MSQILVIDDDERFRSMLRQMLSRAGYTVKEAINGKQGKKICQQEPFDVVITDIIMPEKEGLETIIELRREFPDIKVIAVSGGGMLYPDKYLHTAQLLGAHMILAKPLERDKLLDAIRLLLNKE
jgi:DNA-binding NtrC family response regulator